MVQHFKINSKTITTSILIVGLIGLFFIPRDFLFNESPTLCIYKRLFGFDCPGCGMTRALYSFMHLDLKSAIHLNFSVLVLFPLLITEISLGLHYNKKLFKIRTGLSYFFCLTLLIIYILKIINQLTL